MRNLICEMRPAEPAATRLPRSWTSRLALLTRFRREEDGSIIMFSLFLFILMVIIGGMAVDLMRFETRRVELQGTLDTATLAATNLSQTVDSETLVRDFMEKRGYDPDLVDVTVDATFLGTDSDVLVSRRVDASYDLTVKTFFMHMLDIPTLSTTTGSAAFQGVQNVEIALVLDISGSMDGSKIAALKDAAKSFVRTVIRDEDSDGVTTVSLIPYNDNVVVPDSLLDRLNTTGTINIATPAPYAGALTSFPRTSTGSKCVRFSDDQFITNNLVADYADLRAIRPPAVLPDGTVVFPGTQLDRMAYYDPDSKSAGAGGSWNRPADSTNRRCDPTRSPIVPWASTVAPLEAAIDAMYANGWTAIDNGMKWATALLDPAMRPVVNDMIDNNLLPDTLVDLPGDYDPANTMKVIVLMTDGANTNQYDLKGPYKNGPSRIWFSEKASREWGPNGEDWRNVFIVDSNQNGVKDRNKVWEDGYFVEMPDNPASSRFMRQHRFGTSGSNESDAVLYGVNQLPDDLRQLDYTELYDNFSERAVAEMFRDTDVGDGDAFDDHNSAEELVQGTNSANRRLSGSPRTSTTDFGICDAAKVVRPGEDQPDILVFSIAFDVGASSTPASVLRDCATDINYFYNADNEEELREAFAAIAGAITMLRLTQ